MSDVLPVAYRSKFTSDASGMVEARRASALLAPILRWPARCEEPFILAKICTELTSELFAGRVTQICAADPRFLPASWERKSSTVDVERSRARRQVTLKYAGRKAAPKHSM